MNQDEINSSQQMKLDIKCSNATEIQMKTIIQAGNQLEKSWETTFTWSTVKGLMETNLGRNWIENSPLMGRKYLRVVCMNDKPFTMIAKHYKTTDANKPCEQGMVCREATVCDSTMMQITNQSFCSFG